MTRSEAMTRVEALADESETPDSYQEAADLFRAIFGRVPEQEDGDKGDLFAHCYERVRS